MEGKIMEMKGHEKRNKSKQTIEDESFLEVIRLLLFHLPADIFRFTRTNGDFTLIITVPLDMNNYPCLPSISNDEDGGVN